jgi:hypothetical protein
VNNNSCNWSGRRSSTASGRSFGVRSGSTPCSQRINTDLHNKDPKQRAPTGTKNQEPRTTSRIHPSLAHRNLTVSVAQAALQPAGEQSRNTCWAICPHKSEPVSHITHKRGPDPTRPAQVVPTHSCKAACVTRATI